MNRIKLLFNIFILGLLLSIEIFTQDNFDILSELTTGNTRTIDVENNIIYLNKGGHSIQALEISSTRDFKNIGEFTIDKMGSIQQIVVHNKYVFAAMEYEGLVIIDFNNPKNPQIIGNFKPQTGNHSTNVQYILNNENYLYVNNYNELYVLDITNPYEYKIHTLYDGFEKELGGMKLSGNYLYLLAYSYGEGYELLDISNPEQPTKLQSYNNIMRFKDISFFNNNLYETNGFNGLDIYDNSDPTSPKKIASFDSQDSLFYMSEINLVNEKYCYISCNSIGPTRVYLFNISNINNIIEEGIISQNPLDFIKYNNRLISYGGNSTLAEPIKLYQSDDLSSLILLNSYYSKARYESISIGENHIYAADYISGYLRMINISSTKHMYEENYIKLFDKDSFTSLCYSNNNIYALGYKQIKILDISNETPTIIDSLTLALNAKKLFIQDTLAFAVGKNGFEIISLNGNARVIGILENPETKNILVKESMVYLADGSIKLIDITNPEDPVILEQYLSISDQVNSLAPLNEKIYACSDSYDRILYIFDAHDPKNLSLLKTIEFGYEYSQWEDIKIYNDYAFISLSTGVLRILSLNNPLIPEIIKEIDFGDNITSIVFDSNRMLISYFWGISRLRFDSTSTDVTEAKKIPKDITLYQNYPNPFNPVTKISYSISEATYIQIILYDELGKQVDVLENNVKVPGYYEIEYDASHLTSGIYFYKIMSDKYSETRKMVFIK